MENFKDFCKEHKWAIILVVLGIFIAVLLIEVGFWKTLLFVAVVGICFLLGYLLDKDGPDGVRSFFNGLFGSKKK